MMCAVDVHTHSMINYVFFFSFNFFFRSKYSNRDNFPKSLLLSVRTMPVRFLLVSFCYCRFHYCHSLCSKSTQIKRSHHMLIFHHIASDQSHLLNMECHVQWTFTMKNYQMDFARFVCWSLSYIAAFVHALT